MAVYLPHYQNQMSTAIDIIQFYEKTLPRLDDFDPLTRHEFANRIRALLIVKEVYPGIPLYNPNYRAIILASQTQGPTPREDDKIGEEELEEAEVQDGDAIVDVPNPGMALPHRIPLEKFSHYMPQLIYGLPRNEVSLLRAYKDMCTEGQSQRYLKINFVFCIGVYVFVPSKPGLSMRYTCSKVQVTMQQNLFTGSLF